MAAWIQVLRSGYTIAEHPVGYECFLCHFCDIDNRVLRGALDSRPNNRLRLRVAILTVVCVLQTVSGFSQSPGSSARPQLVEPPKSKDTTAAKPSSIPKCPSAGSHPAAQVNGNHRVILTWNASVPSLQPGGNAVGYCLYRSATKNVADKKATGEFRCTGCEQINFIPVT